MYSSCQIAIIWNLWCFRHFLLAQIRLCSLNGFSDLNCFGFARRAVPRQAGRLRQLPTNTSRSGRQCVRYSVPFYVGNRTTRSTHTDFTDPTVVLPSHYLDQNFLDGGVSRDDYHRRHVIAQGPWRVMHPPSRLLTLFSREHSEVIRSFLRPGQIRDQFLRVAKALHLPLGSGNDMERLESLGRPADAKAEFLAREIWEDVILMSGPWSFGL